MNEDEIYVTCICGALVNEASMSQHFEDCLQEDFVRNSTSLKISKPRSYGEQPPKARHICGNCIRCGHPMYKDKGTLITFYPSVPHSDVTCCYYRDKSGENQEKNESMCKMCKLPNDFHQDRPENEKAIVNCINDIVNSVCENEKAEKCRRQKSMFSKFLERLLYGSTDSSSKDTFDSDGREDTPNSYSSETTPDHHHTVLYDEIHSGPTCRLFHLALIPNYNKNSKDSSYCSYSLLLQILDTLPPGIPVATQTDLPTTIDFGIQVKILGVYPEEVQKLRKQTHIYFKILLLFEMHFWLGCNISPYLV